MRPLGKLAPILAVATLMATGTGIAVAQSPRVSDGPPGPMMLLNRSVRAELKLTDEQVGKLVKAGEAMREQHGDEFKKLRELDGKERRAKREELLKSIREDGQKTAAAILTPEQLTRFQQIQRQQHALHALTTPEIRASLKLSDEQVEQIKTLDADSHKAMRAAFEGAEEGDGNRRKRFEKVRGERRDATARALALLTDEQKAAWKDLTGEPFEVKWDSPDDRGPGRGDR